MERINITVPAELLEATDNAPSVRLNRSEWWRQAARDRLHAEQAAQEVGLYPELPDEWVKVAVARYLILFDGPGSEREITTENADA
jgi:hypothetical protein